MQILLNYKRKNSKNFDIFCLKIVFARNFYDFCSMFKKLQEKWKVNSLNFWLIIATFAIGGSLCGRVGKKLLDLLSVEKGFLWVLLYILLVTVLWPLAVILVSIPLGQFAFFKNYLKKVFARLTGKNKP